MSQQNNHTSRFHDSNSCLSSYQRQSTIKKSPQNNKEKQFFIPNISKHMNPIEKYISQFSIKADDSKQSIQNRTPHITTSKNQLTARDYPRSVDINEFSSYGVLDKTPEKVCVNYDSIAAGSSEQRLEKLSKLQKDYSLLKQKISPHKKCMTGGDFTSRAVYHPFKETKVYITEQDIDKEIKHTHINENGRKYYADLYLLKKGRQNIMSSLSNAGKIVLGSNDSGSVEGLGKLPYEEKVRAKEKQFVCQKITNERQRKRNKMIKGRHLNWNVYYDILALSSSEKAKIKGMSKFPTKFGIA